ncbi:MAG TPA: c-type cytochrome domain-containing protein, partial [Pirellulales bacterium]|nr:c-type cytochrome domain-containing protein [Pirellulales bacterium]
MHARRAFSQSAFLVVSVAAAVAAAEPASRRLQSGFTDVAQPFVRNYCLACHGPEKQEANLDLSGHLSLASVAKDHGVWELVLRRLETDEMPPDDAPRQPSLNERRAIVEWIEAVREDEARRNAGDPGSVPARRLSNSEFDCTVRDLTG